MIVKMVKDCISTLQSWKQHIHPCWTRGGRWSAAAEASQYLDHQFLFSDAAGDQQLLTHTISKADMFADMDALLAVAEQKQIFCGNWTGQLHGG